MDARRRIGEELPASSPVRSGRVRAGASGTGRSRHGSSSVSDGGSLAIGRLLLRSLALDLVGLAFPPFGVGLALADPLGERAPCPPVGPRRGLALDGPTHGATSRESDGGSLATVEMPLSGDIGITSSTHDRQYHRAPRSSVGSIGASHRGHGGESIGGPIVMVGVVFRYTFRYSRRHGKWIPDLREALPSRGRAVRAIQPRGVHRVPAGDRGSSREQVTASTACARCGVAIVQPPTGRRRVYCSVACRVAALRARRRGN